MKLDANVKDKLVPILETACKKPDFGNGRYMRNLLENARMKQASRLLTMDVDNVTKDELTTLIANDFEAPPAQRKESLQIGFCA